MKIIKNKVAYLSLLLSIIMTSCNNTNYQGIKEESTCEQTYVESPLNDNNQQIKIDDISLKYLNKLNDYELVYKHNNEFIDKNDINEIISNNSSLPKCNYLFDGNIDNLVNNIANNSDNSFFDDELNKVILTNVLEDIKNDNLSDINEDFHQISDIKIKAISIDELDYSTYGFLVSYYDDETNIIYICPEIIKLIVDNDTSMYEDYLYLTLKHEFSHVRQTLCNCRKDKSINANLAYDEYVSFFLESSAESILYNKYNLNSVKGYNYELERMYESNLLLLGMFNNKSIDDYYTSIFNTDVNTFLKFFDLNEDEYLEFYQMLYSMDITLNRNDLPNNVLGSDNSYENIFYEFGYQYKEHLYKMIIKKLIQYNGTYNLSLDDSLVINDIIINLIIEDAYIYEDDDINKKVYDEETLNNIKNIEDIYKEYLCEKYKVSLDEIESMKVNIHATAVLIKNYIQTGELNSSFKDDIERIINEFPLLINILNNRDTTLNYYDNTFGSIELKKKF